MQSKKKCFFKHCQKNPVFLCFFIIIYNLKAGKCVLILWSAYSCYIQVVKDYIQYVNCIFIDSETNYLMNYNTNLHSNIIIIIYHDFLPTPRRGRYVKSGKTHTVIKIHPLAHIPDSLVLMFSSCALFTVYPNRIM